MNTDRPERLRVRYFVTANERAVVLALIGDWPPRAAFARMARAGHYLGWRWAHRDEEEAARSSPRHVARCWSSVASFVRWHRDVAGMAKARALCGLLRQEWPHIERLLRKIETKRRAKTRRKERVRS